MPSLFRILVSMGMLLHFTGASDNRFNIERCTPVLEKEDRGLHDWCEDLRNDPEMMCTSPISLNTELV